MLDNSLLIWQFLQEKYELGFNCAKKILKGSIRTVNDAYNITSEMLSIVGEQERTHRSVMLVSSETLYAHAIRMCMLSGVDMLREEL